jgi:hypothetical protein
MAIQNTLVGKLPIAVLKQNVLRNVLRNISLLLPEIFELVAGIKVEHVLMYYELIKASIIGNTRGLGLILEIPKKTAGPIFTFYRMIALPIKIFNDIFAVYNFDSDSFMLANYQRIYLLMTNAGVRKYATGSITVCPADKALLDVEILTCESQLYFQKAAKNGICRRSLLIQYDTLTLIRPQNVCIYRFPKQHQLKIRCPYDGTWKFDTQSLYGAGLIEDATTFEIATNEARTMPELHGATGLCREATPVYAPAEVPILSTQ